jgi:UDP-glucose 4-epimerase
VTGHTRLPFLDLTPGEDHEAIRAAIDRVITRGWFVLGPELEAFEAELAAAFGVRAAVGVGNGTDALALLLRACGVGAGDEVIVPALTAAYTGLAVVAAAARPVIVDVNPDTLTIDPAACELAITPRTRAILPVHLYGQAADMTAVAGVAAAHGLRIVEDCCQAHLATAAGLAVGTWDAGGGVSFYPTKNLGALGDGGAVITNDTAFADHVRRLRNGGQTDRYHHAEAGVNSRLDEVQAAVLRARLPYLAGWTARRRALAAAYRGGLPPSVTAIRERDAGHVYHLPCALAVTRRPAGPSGRLGCRDPDSLPGAAPGTARVRAVRPPAVPAGVRGGAPARVAAAPSGDDRRRRRSRDERGARVRGAGRTVGRRTGVKALITGGAGFVGSHLAERLLEGGHEVLVIDNLSTGSIENIAHLKGRADFTYAVDSVTNESLLAEMIDRSDVVFHLAAAVGVKLIVEQPVHTIETNVHGTEVVLKHANKKKKLVFIASTSEVYGKSADVPFREGADLVLGASAKHRWAYACSKLIDEFLALAYWKEKKLPVVIVRLFNTVGPRQTGQYGMVLPTFVRQALAGQPLTVFGDGTQSRSFTYVGDVVNALIALAQEPRAVGEVFNVGSTTEISIKELAQRVRALAGSESPIHFVPYDKAYEAGFEDMPRRVADISKIRTLIGFEPRLGLDDIIRSVIEHVRQR